MKLKKIKNVLDIAREKNGKIMGKLPVELQDYANPKLNDFEADKIKKAIKGGRCIKCGCLIPKNKSKKNSRWSNVL